MQEFTVRLLTMGSNRLPVLALIRRYLQCSPRECRDLAEAGNLVVAEAITREHAQRLAAQLKQLGAAAEIKVYGDGRDHFV